jgi:D-alanyl-D-alanine carboxypeptidase
MLKSQLCSVIALILLIAAPPCSANLQILDHSITSLLDKYLKQHGEDELVSAISVTVEFPNGGLKTYNVGDANKNSLFQVGSVTKSYVAALILQLEAEGKLNIHQKIGRWLPQYPNWKNVTIKRLLNMTSGIPGYATIPTLLKEIANNPQKQWSNHEIVTLAYNYPHSTKGYNYSDTNYILLAMIIEKVTGHTFSDELNHRILRHFKNTFYADGPYDTAILDREPPGFYYGKTIGKIKHGENLVDANLSMAGAAGALVSNSRDIAAWVRMLLDGSILPAKQLAELKELVSMKNGEPITGVDKHDKSGYALGIAQVYDHRLGHFWIYLGATFAHRAVYASSLCNTFTISITLNSSPLIDVSAKDHVGLLIRKLYHVVLAENPDSICEP